MRSRPTRLQGSTERTRRYRERKRQGVVAVVQCPVYARDIEELVTTGRLAGEHQTDREKIASAVEQLVDDFTESKLIGQVKRVTE